MKVWIILIVIGFVIARILKARPGRETVRRRGSRIRRSLLKPIRPETRAPDVDPAPWREFAEGMGFGFREEGTPIVDGLAGTRPFRLQLGMMDGASTRMHVQLENSVPGRIVVLPRGEASEEDADRALTGDPEFDAEFTVSCRWPALVRRTLSEPVRIWFLGLGDVEALATGKVLTLRLPGYETDLYRLRGLTEMAKEMADAAMP